MTYTPDALLANRLSSGESTIPRDGASSAQSLSSGILRLRYFKALKTEPITKLRTYTGSTPAAPTPTICRVGIFTIDGSGNLTLGPSTTNDTSMWATANTAYEKALDATFSKVFGTWYAVGALCVTGATAPTIAGSSISSTPLGGRSPRLLAQLGSQTDLPASISVGSLAESTISIFAELLP